MRHSIGSFVHAPFGVSVQLAHIARVSRTGSVKLRGFNALRNRWMPNERTYSAEEVDAMPSAIPHPHIPAPPAVK